MPKRSWKRLDIDIYTKIIEIPTHKPKSNRRQDEIEFSSGETEPARFKSETDANWRSSKSEGKPEIKFNNSGDHKPVSEADSNMNWRK